MLKARGEFAASWMMGVDEGLGSCLHDDIADNLSVYAGPGLQEWRQTNPHRDEYPRDFALFVEQLPSRRSSSNSTKRP